jgi:L-alanine-DL-glutamate epimerase-like enolase superfamily enzyme
VQLASVEVIPYALPFKQPYVTARGTLTRREMVLLRLTTEEGLVGLGEAVPLSLRGGVTIEAVVRELEELDASGEMERLVGYGEIPLLFPKEVDPRIALSAPAQCATLTALLDLYAKEAEERAVFPPVICNATLVAGDPRAVAEDALAWAEEGFSTFKLKLGASDDVEQVRAVRDALGPDARIRVDANAVWSLATATEVLERLEPLAIELVEQPVATMEEAALLSRVTSIPLAGDESIVDRADAEWALETEAFQVAGVKGSKVGGFYAGMEIAETMPAYVSSALDGPVGIAAGARLAVAFDEESFHPDEPARAHGLATQRLFAATIATVECELRGGVLHPPPGPGLGIKIDEDALAAHRL